VKTDENMTSAAQQTAAQPPSLLVDAVQGARGDRILFSDLSFTLARGQLLHIAGPNGSGKTTLLRILCGLLTPVEGSVHWHGHDIRSSSSTHRRECTYIGHRDGLKAELTALENLEFNARMSGCRDTQVVDDSLRLLGLWDYQDLLVGHLSAGQRRRLALGRLLVKRAILWILDEPFTAIDVDGRDIIEAQLISHLQGDGIVVLTSHQALSHPQLRERCVTVSLQ
jgi:heme exporter protein A